MMPSSRYNWRINITLIPFSSLDSKEECLKSFNLYDNDHTGRISLKNLKRVAHEIGETMSGKPESHAMSKKNIYSLLKTLFSACSLFVEAELLNIIKKMDTDGDGEISFDEFYAVMSKGKNM